MALGIGVVFVGYWIGMFGFCSLKGPGVGLVDLIVPGRVSGHVIPNPGATAQSTISPSGTAPAGPQNPVFSPPPGSPAPKGPTVIPPTVQQHPGQTEPPLGPGAFGGG
jgi:hypothetical protein